MNTVSLILVLGLTTWVTLIQGLIFCEYKKFTLKNIHTAKNNPCIQKFMVPTREVKCSTYVTYKICCEEQFWYNTPVSRQKWFRAVVYLGDHLSRSCTKRILCEQSCLDGLASAVDGKAEGSHPQKLPTDTKAVKDYVQAYTEGEQAACFGDKGPNFTAASCKAFCGGRYSGCEREMQKQPTLQFYYATSRYFHRLGMWLFTLNHQLLNDTYKQVAERKVPVDVAIEQAFTKLQINMEDVGRQFDVFRKDLLKLNNDHRRKTRVPTKELKDGNVEVEWISFIGKNKNKSALFFSIQQSLEYEQFSDAIMYIRETLEESEFNLGKMPMNNQSLIRSGRRSGSNSVMPVMGLLLFVFLAAGLFVNF